MEADDAALRAYYEWGMERERLSDGRGDLEFTRTTEIVLRRLPAAPAIVADIGGPVLAAAITRWAARIDGMLRDRLYLTYPAVLDLIDEIDRTGMLPSLHEGGSPPSATGRANCGRRSGKPGWRSWIC
jgi:hypothetical protein